MLSDRPARRSIRAGVVALATLVATGCTPADETDETTLPPAPTTQTTDAAIPLGGPDIREAVVQLRPTEGNDARGVIRFTPTADGLELASDLQGLAPGSPHAAHVHVYGDCTDPAAQSAGRHFNFENPGQPTPDATRIVGNLGEFTSGEDGRSSETRTVDGAALEGPASIIGRAVVVHARGNEPGPPPGSQSGARVACGIVGISELAGQEG